MNYLRAFGLLSLLLVGFIEPGSAHQTTLDWRLVLTPDAPQYRAEYWLKRLANSEKIRLSTAEINSSNQQLMRTEKSMVHWSNWPDTLSADDVRARISRSSKINADGLRLSIGQPVSASIIQTWQDNLALDRVVATSNADFGLVVTRTAVRRLPTEKGVFDATGGADIDRLQESALFPGQAVAVLHQSRDKIWLYVQSDNYAGWVQTRAVAMATRAEVMAYAEKMPRRWIAGAQERTVFVPNAPEISELALEMGTSLPWIADWPLNNDVNGQSALAAWVIELPVRDGFGRLRRVPALLPRAADSHSAPLPATTANVIRQSFKFLGERYGWGHDYNARDCSGFVSEVYAALGIRMPRNTGDQQRSLHFKRMPWPGDWPLQKRMDALKTLKAGDLVYIPGHVMLIIGHDQYGPWVIHDVQKSSIPLSGELQTMLLNGVSVTPLRALHLADGRTYIDAITAVQRILPERR